MKRWLVTLCFGFSLVMLPVSTIGCGGGDTGSAAPTGGAETPPPEAKPDDKAAAKPAEDKADDKASEKKS